MSSMQVNRDPPVTQRQAADFAFAAWQRSPEVPKYGLFDYLHAFGYARSQSVRPCYLRSDRDFCMRFRRFIFRLISDKFRQCMGNSR